MLLQDFHQSAAASAALWELPHCFTTQSLDFHSAHFNISLHCVCIWTVKDFGMLNQEQKGQRLFQTSTGEGGR